MTKDVLLTSTEAGELLARLTGADKPVSKQRIGQLSAQGKLTPIVENEGPGKRNFYKRSEIFTLARRRLNEDACREGRKPLDNTLLMEEEVYELIGGPNAHLIVSNNMNPVETINGIKFYSVDSVRTYLSRRANDEGENKK